jgi:hypothetical protein
MSGPARIQRKRTKGWKKPPNAVNVTRPGPFGNPFPVDVYGAAGAVDRFRRWITGNMSSRELSESSLYIPIGISPVFVRRSMLNLLPSLSGKTLVCWCKPGEPCHGDVLLELANGLAPSQAQSDGHRRSSDVFEKPSG